jgi:two-component system NarL family sensor kinase
MLALAMVLVLNAVIRASDRDDLVLLDMIELFYPVGVVVSATAGALVASRTGHAVAWMLIGLAAAVVLSGLCEAYATYGLLVEPGSLAGATWVAPFSEAMFWPAFTCLTFVLLMTPSGRVPRGVWRVVAVGAVVGVVLWFAGTVLSDDAIDPPLDRVDNPWAVDSLQRTVDILAGLGVVMTHLAAVAAVVSLVHRFRRSMGAEREQLRWVAAGAVVSALAVVGALASALAGQDLLLGLAAVTLVVVMPVSITISISWYRLFDLDRVISRSLVSGALAALVTGVYVAIVLLIGWAADTGDAVASGVAAIGAVLAVAPMRTVAQRAADRLLYGNRAEPFAVVSSLNRRLQMSASPEDALRALVDTVAVDLALPAVQVTSVDGQVLAEHGQLDPLRSVSFELAHQGEQVGAMCLGLRRNEDDVDAGERILFEDLARHAGAAVHAAALMRDLRAARQRLVEAQEEERRRLRRDLHDGLGPQLTAVTLKVDAARNLLGRDPARADRVLTELRSDVRAAIDEVRRVVYELRPPGLDELGLVGALRQHARNCNILDSGIDIVVSGDECGGLPAPVEVAAYRIATEAITNAVRHANARRCCVDVSLDRDLIVRVRDDGDGLPVPWRAGVGMTSMRDRAIELGGTCLFEQAKGGGTHVVARLPMEAVSG